MVAKREGIGELKSKAVANPTNGGEEVAKIDSSDLVANSANFPQSEKLSTKKTANLSREQSLQILRDCVNMVAKDGVNVEISDFVSKKSGKNCVILVLENVEYVDDDFVWIE